MQTEVWVSLRSHVMTSAYSWAPKAFPIRPTPASTYMLEGRDQDTEDAKPRQSSQQSSSRAGACRLSPLASSNPLPLGPRCQHRPSAVRLELLLAALPRKRAPCPAPSGFCPMHADLLRSAPPPLPRPPGGVVSLVDLRGCERGSAHARLLRGGGRGCPPGRSSPAGVGGRR